MAAGPGTLTFHFVFKTAYNLPFTIPLEIRHGVDVAQSAGYGKGRLAIAPHLKISSGIRALYPPVPVN